MQLSHLDNVVESDAIGSGRTEVLRGEIEWAQHAMERNRINTD